MHTQGGHLIEKNPGLRRHHMPDASVQELASTMMATNQRQM
jgi:hypothetical protein